jgi:C4-dicarboxylate-specific signal transduction histidine kinase
LENEEQRLQLSHLARVASLGQLSGAFAHELNQQLMSIRSNAEAGRLLLGRRPLNLAELDAILNDIVHDDQQAAEVIRRLRGLLKRGEAQLQPLDMNDLVAEVLALARAELIGRMVAATTTVEPDLPQVMGDRVQLQQLLLNLIINACDAMRYVPASDRRLSLTATEEGPNHVHLSIRDHGTGIPAGLIDRLFEPFVSTKPEGLGLGLSISRTIAAAHGGRLWAENNVDGGSTFHCLLTTMQRVAPSAHAAALVDKESLQLVPATG